MLSERLIQISFYLWELRKIIEGVVFFKHAVCPEDIYEALII